MNRVAPLLGIVLVLATLSSCPAWDVFPASPPGPTAEARAGAPTVPSSPAP
jgi:hypothetical protein